MIRSVFQRTSAVILSVCMLCLMVMMSVSLTAAAEETGSVTVQVYDEFEGIPLYLIEIGTYEDNKLVMDEQYSGLGIRFDELKTSGDMDKAANEVQEFVKKQGITGMMRWINTEGNVVFEDVPLNKIYFVMQCMGEEVVKIQPLILTLPRYADGKAEVNVLAKAKYVDNRSMDSEGAVILNKLGRDDIALPDAVFEFSQKIYYTDASKLGADVEVGEDEVGTYYWKPFKQRLVTDENGQIVVTELAFATFRFVEVQAPDGYILDPTPQVFDVAKHGSVKVENGRYAAVNNGTVVLSVRNAIDDKWGEDSESASEIELEDSIIEDISGKGEESSRDISGGDIQGEGSVLEDSGRAGEDSRTELTGDDIVKYCTTGAVVCTSLAVIILLIVIGNRSSKKEE